MRQELHTPWSDVITLEVFPDNQDAEGYGVDPVESREIMCTFQMRRER